MRRADLRQAAAGWLVVGSLLGVLAGASYLVPLGFVPSADASAVDRHASRLMSQISFTDKDAVACFCPEVANDDQLPENLTC